MSDHTPTPWFKGRKFEIGPRLSTDDQSDGMLCPVADVYGDNREADAAFIVKAVNHHDALVGVLTELYAQVRGECPSLLNEDSGGDGTLDLEIRALLDAVSSQKEPS